MYFSLGRCSFELAQRLSRVALASHTARRGIPFGVTIPWLTVELAFNACLRCLFVSVCLPARVSVIFFCLPVCPLFVLFLFPCLPLCLSVSVCVWSRCQVSSGPDACPAAELEGNAAKATQVAAALDKTGLLRVLLL